MRSITQTAFLMAILTLISKLFGFAREMVMANYFGTSYVTDAYVMAINIPSIIFVGIFGAISTAYIPLFSKIDENEGAKESNLFTSRVLNLIIIISIISSMIGFLFSDQIVYIFANGFEGKTAELTSFFVKITFTYILFSATSEILEAHLQYRGIFLPQIWIGYVQNIIIIGVIVISALFNHYLLVLGWLGAYITRCFVMFFLARRKKFKHSPSFVLNNTVKEIFSLAIPVFIGSGISQINIFVDRFLASGLKEGSVSALNYSMLVVTMIASLTTSILITIIYPRLNQANSLHDIKRFSMISSMGMNLTVLFALPCFLGSVIYNNQIVKIIYERGAFDSAATGMTSSAFLYYSAAILFTAVNTLIVKIYYSMHDMKTPVFYSAFGVIINIILSLILVRSMAINGLALATSISIICSTILLYFGLRRKYPILNIIQSKRKLLYIIIAAVFSVGSSYLVFIFIETTFSFSIILQMMLVVIIAAFIYLILLIVFRIEEVNLIKELIKIR